MERICTKCKEEKNYVDFYKDKRRKDGYRSQCKLCENKENNLRESKYKDYRKNYRNTETYKNIKKEYYKKNREKILNENSEWRQTFNGRLNSYKNSAEKRNIKWLLSDNEFKLFWGIPCSYCGVNIKTIGIDRVDNTKHYELNNCVSCCSTCNKMKMNLTKDKFIDKILEIFKNLKLNE